MRTYPIRLRNVSDTVFGHSVFIADERPSVVDEQPFTDGECSFIDDG